MLKMSDYVQHVKATVTVADDPILRIECEKTGTVYWQHNGTNAWCKEDLLKSTRLTHTELFERKQ